MYRTITLHPHTGDERELTRFERALGEAVLGGSDPRLEPAREQLRRATVKEREMTEWGFYVDLVIPDDAPRGDPTYLSTPLGGASVSGPEIAELFTSHACCADGRLTSLEGVYVGDEKPTFELIERMLLDRMPGVELVHARES